MRGPGGFDKDRQENFGQSSDGGRQDRRYAVIIALCDSFVDTGSLNITDYPSCDRKT